MNIPYYPIQDYGPVMKGMAIGGLGIFHVFLAQMAIGGGMLLCYFEWLRQTGRSKNASRFIDGYFQALILVSFVLGALTGVAMWFTSIQVSPRTIGVMVGEFHWIWATEWSSFCLEVVAGYTFLRYKDVLSDRGRMTVLIAYTTAAWFSLFWVNGILSWQLTPGRWIDTHSVFSGFFNPSFWPSLLYRTLAAMTLAALSACVVINVSGPSSREDRQELIGHAAKFLIPMILMPVLGIWFLASMPPDSRSYVLGGSVVMTMFLNIGVGASLLIGLYGLLALVRGKLYINGYTAALLACLAFAATAGGEFVREGVRKPYSIRKVLYSNSIRGAEIARLREFGSVTDDPYPLHDGLSYPNDQLRLGAKVFRFQCGVCHTYEGANAVLDLLGTWSLDQKRLNIAQLQRTKTFMPPFSGEPSQLEALVQMLTWRHAGMPAAWPVSHDAATLVKIKDWLDEVGTTPGPELMKQGRSAKVAAADSEHPLMDVIFPFGFPWPSAFYLVLFTATLAIYMVFMQYVLAGSAVMLIRSIRGLTGGTSHAIVTNVIHDWLPAILGLAITTGVAPLLFLQVLYKREFYTANLLLFHRFMLLLPALIVAYYMLYLLKSKRAALHGAGAMLASSLVCACFAYTASAWAENHLLSLNSGTWVEHYASGRWFYRSWELLPRLAIWLSASFSTLAIALAWQIHWGRRKYDEVAITTAARRLRAMALDGLVATTLAAIAWLILLNSKARAPVISALGMPYLTLAAVGLAIQGHAWWPVKAGAELSTGRLLLISTGTAAEILGTVVVREARRLGSIDISALYDAHREAAQVGGMWIFLTFFAINATVIAGCVVLVARALAAKAKQSAG